MTTINLTLVLKEDLANKEKAYLAQKLVFLAGDDMYLAVTPIEAYVSSVVGERLELCC